MDQIVTRQFSARMLIGQRAPTRRAVTCIVDILNFMLFTVTFIKLKAMIEFKKFELHNYGQNCFDIDYIER